MSHEHKVINILFDLDGTLTDPVEGITKSMQYALARLGGVERSQAELVIFIGPPLRRTFAELLGTDDPERIEGAIRLYRERFSQVGLFENIVYPGVADLLAGLHHTSRALFVATAKPRIFANQILEHFSLAQYFQAVYGAELDGRFGDKGSLVAHLLDQERLAPERTLMIGDRRHDIEAARQHGLRTIGVTYGYGTADELLEAGADLICHTPAEIAAHFW
jgi:phosphoglycolate phosphatase